MADKGTVFQKGGGGTNFEQYIQAAFVTTMLVRGNVPSLPQNEITEITLQASNKGWETDDILVVAKSGLGNHQLLIQSKHTIVFSEDNKIFNEVITAFWKDFNSPCFNKVNDRLLIVKNRLNNVEKNHIKGILNYAKSHSSEIDFISEVNRIKEKKERLNIFRKVVQVVNNNNEISDNELWSFLKCLDVLGYDFLDEGSVDESYFLNLIKLSKNISNVIGEKDIWNSIVTYITKSNPAGGSLTRETIKEKEFYCHFDCSRLEPAYKSVEKLLNDSEAILKPLKNIIGNSTIQYHIPRPATVEDIVSAANESNFTIVTGKAGVGKSASVKNMLAIAFSESGVFVFRADQFNRPHLANVLSDMGIHQSLSDLFSCLSLMPQKVIFIDSLEKLLEDADPDNAFKQLISFVKEKGIRIIGTSRKYAIELLIQKYGIEQAGLKIVEIPLLSSEELIEIVKHFPALSNSLKNDNIKTLLQTPKYLDFTIRSLPLSTDDFKTSSITQFKDNLWNSLVCNASYRANGLPAKRELAFMNIALNRARKMKLFVKPVNVDPEAVDLLESDDIIFQEGSKRNYAPSHDILEDWALVKYVSAKYDDNNETVNFFSELGNEPAIRRAFRLWVEDYLVDQPEKVNRLIRLSISENTIERYWADELLIAVFKSDSSAYFFSSFEVELLANNATFLNRCVHLIKTACRESNYEVHEKPVLMPIGSGWKEALSFIKSHLEGLDSLRISVLNFLDHWEYRLIFHYPKDKSELQDVSEIVLFYIAQIERSDEFWSERSTNNNQKLLISILFNLTSFAKEQITGLVKRAINEEDERGNWRLHSFYEKVLEKFLSGVGTQSISLALPDLIIETAWKHWKYIPPVPQDDDEYSFTSIPGDYIDKDHCWGIDEKFSFFPSGIYKIPIYNLLTFHPWKAIKFITEFINYSVDFYVNAKCNYKHEVSEVYLMMPDETKVKQWAGWELWVAYRGISVTDYLLECLLMTLEKYLLELAAEKTEDSRKSLKLVYNYLLRSSNSVMITGVLVSVAIAYPTEVGEEMLPIVPIKEIYRWESARPLQERSTFAPYDDHIPFAQKIRWESNQLPHRTKYQRGFADFLVDYQLTIGTLNPQLVKILDKMWSEAAPDDIVWRKKLHEIDTRKWEVSEFEKGSGQFTIQPKYEATVATFMDTGKEQMEAANKAAGYSLKLNKLLDGTEQTDLETWDLYYKYYSSLNAIDILHDKPVTCAVIGLRDFVGKLTEEQLSWCIRTLCSTIGTITGETNNRSYSLSTQYNLMEKQVALESFHLLFNVVTEDEDINELTFMMAYALIAPFADHEIERLTEYVRLTFSKQHPEIARKLWWVLLKFSLFKKVNHFYYDDPDVEALKSARKKQFDFVEDLCKNQRVNPIDFSSVNFTKAEPSILCLALLIMPCNKTDEQYRQFLFRFIELLTIDLRKDDDSPYRRSRGRVLDHRLLFNIQKYLSELLLKADQQLASDVIACLTSAVYTTKEAELAHDGNLVEFVYKTLNLLIYKIDDCALTEKDPTNKSNTINRFWILWNDLYLIILKSKKQYFTSVLLFDTEISWQEERQHSDIFDGKAKEYQEMLFSFGKTNIKSAIKVLSTIGSQTFLPEGLIWITTLLRKNPDQIADINTISCERLIKRLYYNHVTTIKKNQPLVNEFIWLLDKMIDLENSTAYLFRENVISYKKYN